MDKVSPKINEPFKKLFKAKEEIWDYWNDNFLEIRKYEIFIIAILKLINNMHENYCGSHDTIDKSQIVQTIKQFELLLSTQ